MDVHRREKPAFGVLWSEVLADHSAPGGVVQFVAAIDASPLGAGSHIATVSAVGDINIGVAIHTQQVIVLLGESARHTRKIYQIPRDLGAHDGTYKLQVTFQGLTILNVQLNGIALWQVNESDADTLSA